MRHWRRRARSLGEPVFELEALHRLIRATPPLAGHRRWRHERAPSRSRLLDDHGARADRAGGGGRTKAGGGPNVAIARALDEGAGCEPDELAEVGDEVRLIVIARFGGDAYPVLRRRRPPHRALQANGPREVLGPDADTNLNDYEGTETVEEGAREAVRLALLGPDGPTGTFSHATLGRLPW
jgi:hypothetical protein